MAKRTISNIVRIPENKRPTITRLDAALVIVLPVVRIERPPEGAPCKPARRKR